jgi:hypothetical protein
MPQGVLHRFIAAATGLYLLAGAGATYRALSQPRLAVEASPPCHGTVSLTVTVDTSGRGDTDIAVDLLEGAEVCRVRDWTVARRRYAFWDPRPLHHVTQLRVPATLGGPSGPAHARLRVSAQTQSWWLTRRAPVVAEVELGGGGRS